ncbi:MAG: D-glycerate dehydrogenase [Saprospiraceae bacterium]|nr:D-glycerate dehydrogenase [Saprospiraceae bacterium]
MARILITRRYPENGLAMLRAAGHLLTEWKESDPMSRSKLVEMVQGHQGMMCTGTERIDAAFLDQAPDLRVIAQFAVGYDNIDIDAVYQRGVAVSNTPNAMNAATADIAFGLMIAAARRMFHWSRWISTGAWGAFEPQAQLGLELHGKTLGIVGMGRIGMEMARRCRGAYDMRILYHNRSQHLDSEQKLNAKWVSFEELLRESDIVSAHCPLTENTRHLFDQKAFASMKDSAIFINTARGAVHHEQDLIEALERNAIWAAGLDVTDPEPMSPDNPLLTMPNACVVPHLGSATFTAREAMSKMAAENLLAFFEGKTPPNQIPA